MTHSESELIENKTSLNEWREVVESVAAFATSKGGTVLVGVDPNGKRVGVQIGRTTIEDLANKIKTNTDPPQYPSISVDGPDHSAVIVILAEENPIKPVWAFGRPVKRVGRTNQRLSREEAQRMAEATTGRTWDALPCLEFHKEDVEKKYVNDFLRRADLQSVPLPTLLKNMSLLTGENILCNGTVLLFARNPQQFFPEAQVKCARFAGTTSVKFLDDQTIEGNIMSQLDNALAFVKRNTQQELRITGKVERDVIPEYPEEAVREAITNAVCHRDYSAVGTVQIRIYNDRMEVWNPGMLPQDLSVDTLFTDHPSRPRNPKIAQVLHRARIIEHWGTGTLRMLALCQKSGIKLEFLSEQGLFIVRFIKPETKAQQLTEVKLNDRQRKAIEYVREQGQITNHDYQKLCNVSRRQALKDLNELVDRNLLIRAGSGRSVRYLLDRKG